jgi:glycosyltransferase involved in cell wall biosynthesis
MRRYALWLERNLKARGYKVTLLKPQPFFGKLTRHPGLIKYLGYLDRFLLFPPRLRRVAKSHDLVHVLDHSNSMYLQPVHWKPNLITCHDVLAIRAARGEFRETQTSWTGKLLQRWILSGLRTARYVLCDSHKTASDLTALTGNIEAHLHVQHLAINWSYGPNAVLPAGLIDRLGLRSGQMYFLHVGGEKWYKNRLGVVRLFTRLSVMEQFTSSVLVLVGHPLPPATRSLIRNERLDQRVIEAGNVTNEELQALYCNAMALVFPSLQEGFGWPILEAQACGCPVITTGRPPMSEVAGDAAILIDPEDVEAAAERIAEGMKDSEGLRTAGFHNLERFNEETVVNGYCAFYEAIFRDWSHIDRAAITERVT